jgi:tetratricopeptide (TPR) repeat protein
MSRPLAAAVLGLILAGSGGLLAENQSPYAAATEAVNSGVKRLEKQEYEAALKDFDAAVALAPALSDAIRHRAEVYLGLNRLTDAKQAYMHLFVHDRTASAVLMNAMKTWVEKRLKEPMGIDAADLVAFDAWVRERDALAAAVVNLGHNSPDWK